MTRFEERINQLFLESISALKEIDIQPSKNIIAVKENRRAKKRLGCCKKEKRAMQDFFIIEISTVLKDESDERIKEVMLHELLHTCKGCFNHGKAWKALAEKVNQSYGYHISTYADANYLETVRPQSEPYRYAIVCTRCGNIGYRRKKSKVITQIKNYRCSKCGGSLQVREI